MPQPPSRVLRLDVASALGAAWRDAPVVAIGEVVDSIVSPREYVLLREGERPLLRLDVYLPPEEYHLRCEAAIWAEWIVAGFGARVELVSLRDHRRRAIPLSDATPPDSFDYFCKIECNDAALLVTSGRRVFRIGADGALLWVSPEVGLDGVIVGLGAGDVIEGSGEWDPPGGWVDFRLSLASGQKIEG